MKIECYGCKHLFSSPDTMKVGRKRYRLCVEIEIREASAIDEYSDDRRLG